MDVSDRRRIALVAVVLVVLLASCFGLVPGDFLEDTPPGYPARTQTGYEIV